MGLENFPFCLFEIRLFFFSLFLISLSKGHPFQMSILEIFLSKYMGREWEREKRIHKSYVIIIYLHTHKMADWLFFLEHCAENQLDDVFTLYSTTIDFCFYYVFVVVVVCADAFVEGERIGCRSVCGTGSQLTECLYTKKRRASWLLGYFLLVLLDGLCTFLMRLQCNILYCVSLCTNTDAQLSNTRTQIIRITMLCICVCVLWIYPFK